MPTVRRRALWSLLVFLGCTGCAEEDVLDVEVTLELGDSCRNGAQDVAPYDMIRAISGAVHGPPTADGPGCVWVRNCEGASGIEAVDDLSEAVRGNRPFVTDAPFDGAQEVWVRAHTADRCRGEVVMCGLAFIEEIRGGAADIVMQCTQCEPFSLSPELEFCR